MKWERDVTLHGTTDRLFVAEHFPVFSVGTHRRIDPKLRASLPHHARPRQWPTITVLSRTGTGRGLCVRLG